MANGFFTEIGNPQRGKVRTGNGGTKRAKGDPLNQSTAVDSIAKVKAIASRPEPGYILPGHESLIIMEPL